MKKQITITVIDVKDNIEVNNKIEGLVDYEVIGLLKALILHTELRQASKIKLNNHVLDVGEKVK